MRHDPPRPNLFIVGAPRSGTTALHAYLRTHPGIFMSDPKEPMYWADDLPGAMRSSWAPVSTLDAYLALFAGAEPHHRVIGEASPIYLRSHRAIARIEAFQPEARYIALLRDPVDLVASYHMELLYLGYEDVSDLGLAWALQDERRRGHRIPPGCVEPELLQYEAMAKLGEQVERMLSLVPRARVKFIFFPELAENPRRVYQETLAFLGLPDDGRRHFPRTNAAKRLRIPALARALYAPPPVIAPLIHRIRRAYAHTHPRLQEALAKLLRPDAARRSIDPGLRATLTEAFRDDAQLLARLTARDGGSPIDAHPAPPEEHA
ncbi:Sulfotransferase [Minicystis rosea]|nr:Sulfotransferase [Minicystis rosea]